MLKWADELKKQADELVKQAKELNNTNKDYPDEVEGVKYTEQVL